MLFFQVSLILQFQQLAHLCHLCLQATRLTTSWEDDGRFFSSKQDMFAQSTSRKSEFSKLTAVDEEHFQVVQH